MNIGLLVYDISLTGGAERVALNMAAGLTCDYEICLISLFNSRQSSLNEDAKYKKIVLSEKTRSITFNFYSLARDLKKCLIKENIDVLIAITAGVVTLANFASRALKTNTIFAEHSNLENKTYGFKHILRQFIGAHTSDIVITLTERDRLNFIRLFKVKPSKVMAIPNWIEKPITTKQIQYDIKSKLIISVGRLEEVKGYNYLIEVAKKVLFLHNDWKWHIYGEGSLHAQLQQTIEKEKLTEKLFLMGNVQDIYDRYAQYSFMVMTSKYEGLPLSLIEAQSQGLPLVSFDCPTGPSEIIKDGFNGYLIKPYNTNEMAKKINELIEDKNKRVEFSRQANVDLHKFSKSCILEQWKAVIEKFNGFS